MAISDSQKIDLLLKKLGYGVAKTDTFANKSPANEIIASPLMVRGDLIWVQSDAITETPPGASTNQVNRYMGIGRIECVADSTATTNRTWKTNLADWIPPEFGSGYQVRIWAAPASTPNPSNVGTRLYPDGSGNNDSWFFDYQAGVLNFPDTNIPSGVAGNTIFVEGYRYVGSKGFSSGLNEGFVNRGSDPSDWNANTTFGLFTVNRISWSGTIGSPTDAPTVGMLIVFVSDGICVQKYQPNETDTNGGSEYYRTKLIGESWTTWTKVVSEYSLVDGGTF